MLVHLRRSVVLALSCLVIFGLVYPLAGTGISRLVFEHQANGSIGPNGSTLIGQTWTGAMWFHGRPDGTGPYAANARVSPPVSGGDNPLVANGTRGQSGATNLGPRSAALVANTKRLLAYWHALGVQPTPDLVTPSGSGLDPDITPQDAIVQIPMVARARHLPADALRRLIESQTHHAQFGFLGSSYVVVLELNQALAGLK